MEAREEPTDSINLEGGTVFNDKLSLNYRFNFLRRN
jgi:hypothetical protein